MSRRFLPVVLVLALLVVPSVLAHTPGDPSEPDHIEPEDEQPLPAGYTGPGRAPYLSYFEGSWLYGQATVTPLDSQIPRGMHADGEWIVWEDARVGDIYAFNVPAGQGYYLTQDGWSQRRPQVSDGVVVWEDYRHGPRANVYAYFLETGETRRITHEDRVSHLNPAIGDGIIAWEDDRNDSIDIWAHSLLNDSTFPVTTDEARDSDPFILDGTVYWRTYRFNVWDVVANDLAREDQFPLTSDTAIQSAPFSNGQDVLFLTQHFGGWKLERYDVQRERVITTPVRLNIARDIPASGEHLLQVARDGRYTQLVARNLTTGDTTHVTGNIVLVDGPLLMGTTAFAAVATANGTSLLQLDISPFAFGKSPSVSITSPGRVATWLRPITVRGLLVAGPGWTEPLTFTYRVDGGAPQVIPPGQRWEFTLDNEGIDPGNHFVSIRATFREGPPVETSLTLVVPSAARKVDVEEAGPAYHAARVMREMNVYILQNPAAYVITPLVLVLAGLLAFRAWLHFKPRERVQLVEYVPPPDEL